jgi:hypothetical protein
MVGPGNIPGAMPTRGVFATSEVLPLMREASHKLADARAEHKRLRDEAAHRKADAKRIRANLMVNLRVWGNEATGDMPMKTSVERNEWADADANVQQAELAADLAQSAAMDSRAALDAAEAFFSSLQGMLAIERDENRAERGAPHVGP